MGKKQNVELFWDHRYRFGEMDVCSLVCKSYEKL